MQNIFIFYKALFKWKDYDIIFDYNKAYNQLTDFKEPLLENTCNLDDCFSVPWNEMRLLVRTKDILILRLTLTWELGKYPLTLPWLVDKEG